MNAVIVRSILTGCLIGVTILCNSAFSCDALDPDICPAITPEAEVKPRVNIRYTLENLSGEIVHFRLPSGRNYMLRPGESGNYRNTGNFEDLTIHIYNSGQTYGLTNGIHMFGWSNTVNQVYFQPLHRTRQN